ncbi:IS3 family transposase [Lentibacillus sp. JNUCC-1]|uniref:IS3 family transposase n=1 Tax=Lentibacillus sp. JNUCC-1 TaxID=2654513 RepID=UPI0012E86E1C|nr:IS3 family transposase [Lentibacillus sp. JNUCC-1]
MTNKRYSEEQKTAALKRMMPPQNESVKALSKETGISDVTLYKWRKEARASGNAAPGNGQTSDRWSSEDKFLVVMETYAMNEKEIAEYCRKKGLYREQINAWQEACLQANGKALGLSKELNGQLKEEKQRSQSLEKDLKKKEKALAEAAALLLLRKKGPSDLGGPRGRMIDPSDRLRAVELIQEANRNGARLSKACEELHIHVRTYQRWVAEGDVKIDQRPHAERPIPKNKISEEERTEILEVVNQESYADLPPTQIIPLLADQGKYIASESTFYRVLREEKMQNHRGRSQKPKKRIPESHLATAPNQVWTWDITWLGGPVKGLFYRLYLILDLFSRKVVGWEVWETEEAQYAEKLVKKAVLKEEIKGRPLVLHSDNGSPMKAATFLGLLETLGIQSSFSRPRVSNDNPYSEAMFRTLKYRPEFPHEGFVSLEEARKWASQFVEWYNDVHLHSALNFVTPVQCHNGAYKDILAQRQVIYEQAKQKHPERWGSRGTRDWSPHEEVALNPMREDTAVASGDS